MAPKEKGKNIDLKYAIFLQYSVNFFDFLAANSNMNK